MYHAETVRRANVGLPAAIPDPRRGGNFFGGPVNRPICWRNYWAWTRTGGISREPDHRLATIAGHADSGGQKLLI